MRGRLDATGCACDAGPAATETAARLASMRCGGRGKLRLIQCVPRTVRNGACLRRSSLLGRAASVSMHAYAHGRVRVLMHQGGAPHAPLLSRTTCLSPQGARFTQHARGAFQDFSPSTCTHQYHHCIIHTHHSCILLATSFTHNTLLLTWPRSTERRGCSLYPGARVEF